MSKSIMEKNFEEIFDLPVEEKKSEVEVIEASKPVSTEDTNDVDADYQYARENLYNVIDKGSDALSTLVELANQSESPRAFEIVGQLIKTLSDSNKDLLELQSKVKKIKDEEPKGPNSVTNALFIGNTAELQKMIKDRKKDV